MKYYYLLFTSLIFCVEGCERSLEVRGVEDYCWTKNVEVVERLQYTGKSFLNFAKKTLGLDVESSNQPQKCDYYNCIFQELKMLNGEGYPCRDRMTKWIKSNVIYNHAEILLSGVDACSAGLAKSISSKTRFSADKIEGTNPKDGNETDETPQDLQGKCDVTTEYMKCMSMTEKDDCPVFEFP